MTETPDTGSADALPDVPKRDLSWLDDDDGLGAVTPETAEAQIPTEGPIPPRPPLATPNPLETSAGEPRFKLPTVQTVQEAAAKSKAFQDLVLQAAATPDQLRALNAQILARYKDVVECFKDAEISPVGDKQFVSLVTNFLVLINAQYITNGRLPPPEAGSSDGAVPLPAGLAPELAGLGATRAALAAGVDITDSSNDGT